MLTGAHAHLCINGMCLWDPFLAFGSFWGVHFCQFFFSTHFLLELFTALIPSDPYFSSFLSIPLTKLPPWALPLFSFFTTVSSIQQAFSECQAPVRFWSWRAIRQNLRPQVAQSRGTCNLPSSLCSGDRWLPRSSFLPAYSILVITKHWFIRN